MPTVPVPAPLQAVQVVRAEIAATAPPPRLPAKLEAHQRVRQADRDACFAGAARLAKEGLGIKAIRRESGLSRNTVRC